MGRRVTIKLIDVTCRNTEDVTGADDFYIIGGANNRQVLISPIHINDGQTKTFPADQATIFSQVLEKGQSVGCTLMAYDEDAAKDWGPLLESIPVPDDTSSSDDPFIMSAAKFYETNAETSTTADTGGAAGEGGAASVDWVAVAKAVWRGVKTVVSADKDDLLGKYTFVVTNYDEWDAQALEWRVKGGSSWWSNWDFTVRIQVEVEATEEEIKRAEQRRHR